MPAQKGGLPISPTVGTSGPAQLSLNSKGYPGNSLSILVPQEYKVSFHTSELTAKLLIAMALRIETAFSTF